MLCTMYRLSNGLDEKKKKKGYYRPIYNFLGMKGANIYIC